MLRVLLLVFLVFLFLTVLRGLRVFWTAFLRTPRETKSPRRGAPRDEEMVRDPVCGTWVDRRLALSGKRGSETVAVCSEACRKSLEAR